MESRSTDQSVLRNLDWVTIIIYVVLVIAGVFSIYAASYDFDEASIFDFNEFSGKQIRWIGFAAGLAVVLLIFDYRVYETYAYPVYFIMLAIMAVTIVVAPDINGSRSWLVFGPLRFQPAEFGKFATALALAKLFSGYNFKLNSRKGYLRALSIIFIPVMLILAQKETGSALAYLALFFVLYREGMSGLVLLGAFCAVLYFVIAVKFSGAMMFGMTVGEMMVMVLIMTIMVCMLIFYCRRNDIARNVLGWFTGCGLLLWLLIAVGVEVPARPFFLGVLTVACAYCFLLALKWKNHRFTLTASAAILSVIFLFSVNYTFNKVLQPHQQQRIMVTLGMEDDPLGAGYNVNQAKIAIGSGGLFGKGHLNGTQTKLKYVPEQHTDFIYCTIGEEQGFIGCTAVLLTFLILILRVIHIAERQPSVFGRVYGYCVASYFIFHLAINTGMVIGLCPVIGIPLPFFSYGGSSLWSFTILLFILLRIDASRKQHPSFI